uniref:Uncharacterized protein n=1 Tax=Anguilla anguilla TaxID=7936 RepID=A0A0E9PRL2_ANGAN
MYFMRCMSLGQSKMEQHVLLNYRESFCLSV